jgi:hypothetical protein
MEQCKYLRELERLVGPIHRDVIASCLHEAQEIIHPTLYCKRDEKCKVRVRDRIRRYIGKAKDRALDIRVVLSDDLIKGVRDDLRAEIQQYYNDLAIHLRSQGLDPLLIIPYGFRQRSKKYVSSYLLCSFYQSLIPFLCSE